MLINSRVIKFRAWDKKKKVMTTDFFLTPDGHWTVFDSEDGGKSGLWEHDISDDYDLEIMQFTGLKDKNGKEIYEGDILGRESYTNWVVGWKAPSFIIYNITNPDSQYTIWNIDIEEREVIGNIYENPELLNVPSEKGE